HRESAAPRPRRGHPADPRRRGHPRDGDGPRRRHPRARRADGAVPAPGRLSASPQQEPLALHAIAPMNASAKSRIQNAVDTIPRIRPASARPPFGPPSFARVRPRTPKTIPGIPQTSGKTKPKIPRTRAAIAKPLSGVGPGPTGGAGANVPGGGGSGARGGEVSIGRMTDYVWVPEPK